MSITVVVPAYNHEDYISEALLSVVRQTYCAVELVVIDDCSSDRTFEVVQDILVSQAPDRFVNIIVKRHDVNRGAHFTINEGIELGSQPLATVLNSDDFFAVDRLERMLKLMTTCGSQLGFSGVQPVGKDSRPIHTTRLPPSLLDAFHYGHWAEGVFPSLSFALLSRNIAVSTGNIIFSKHLYRRLGGFRDYKYIHDWDFLLRGCLMSEPVFDKDTLYSYRLHETNSFSSLKDVGEREIDDMTLRFFNSLTRLPENPLAPSPVLWPGCYEALETELYLVRRAKLLKCL